MKKMHALSTATSSIKANQSIVCGRRSGPPVTSYYRVPPIKGKFTDKKEAVRMAVAVGCKTIEHIVVNTIPV